MTAGNFCSIVLRSKLLIPCLYRIENEFSYLNYWWINWIWINNRRGAVALCWCHLHCKISDMAPVITTSRISVLFSDKNFWNSSKSWEHYWNVSSNSLQREYWPSPHLPFPTFQQGHFKAHSLLLLASVAFFNYMSPCLESILVAVKWFCLWLQTICDWFHYLFAE